MSENRYYFAEQQLPLAIKTAYALSRPHGTGHLHARPGDLDDEAVKEIMDAGRHFAAAMDYVHGRAVKLTIRREPDGRLWIPADHWFDHSLEQLRQLAVTVGMLLTGGDRVETPYIAPPASRDDDGPAPIAFPVDVSAPMPDLSPSLAGGGDFSGGGASGSWDSGSSSSADFSNVDSGSSSSCDSGGGGD